MADMLPLIYEYVEIFKLWNSHYHSGVKLQ